MVGLARDKEIPVEKQGYLKRTNFVFAIVIERMGFCWSLILALLFFLILRIILVGIRARAPFDSMMAIGIGGTDLSANLH